MNDYLIVGLVGLGGYLLYYIFIVLGYDTIVNFFKTPPSLKKAYPILF
jgi:hypothetical protein